MEEIKIYSLSDNTGVRYVGKTEKSLKERFNGHKHDKSNTHKANWVKKVGSDNIKIGLLEICTKENWGERERYYIDFFKKEGCNILNMAVGGGGGVLGRKPTEEQINHFKKIRRGHIVSDETKKKISDSLKKLKDVKGRFGPDNKPIPYKRTQEHIEQIRDRMKGNLLSLGYKKTDETKKKISDYHKGTFLSEEIKNKISISKK